MKFDEFTEAYMKTALWAELDDDNLPYDQGEYELAPETIREMVEDCRLFQEKWGHLIAGWETEAGHDFWLTRRGHGAGFWDGDWPDPLGDQLTEASKAFGNVDLYTGDDGLVYQQ
jgi:hypothetical protein